MHEALYRSLYRIRRVEEEAARIYPTDEIKSPMHLSIGQEAVSVGVCAALRPEDVVFGTYRGHALYLAKGGDLPGMVAELYGKRTGCALGKGGSMHLIDVSVGMMGASAVVATTIPHAVGYAFALKARGSDAVVASFFGDAAVEEGAFHESLNFAALKRLPVLFVCENNGYSVHTPLRERQPRDNIYERAAAYGIPSRRLEEDDVLAVRDAAAEMRARLSEGPCFLEVRTYRWYDHVGPDQDFAAGYRSLSEAEPWFARDQVRRMAERIGPERSQAIAAEVEEEIRAAFEFAERSAFPPPEDLYSHVYKEEAPL